jgi:hypothetical protein
MISFRVAVVWESHRLILTPTPASVVICAVPVHSKSIDASALVLPAGRTKNVLHSASPTLLTRPGLYGRSKFRRGIEDDIVEPSDIRLATSRIS